MRERRWLTASGVKLNAAFRGRSFRGAGVVVGEADWDGFAVDIVDDVLVAAGIDLGWGIAWLFSNGIVVNGGDFPSADLLVSSLLGASLFRGGAGSIAGISSVSGRYGVAV